MYKEVLKKIILDKQNEIPFNLISREDSLPINCGSIVTVPGVRRCGKTSKMKLVINSLVQNGLDKSLILWVGFDDERLFDMQVSDLEEVLDAYRELYPETELKNVQMFFDEIQNIKNWELFIIRVFKNYCSHIFISGSNAKLLSSEIATELRGWGLEYTTFPLSFKEYCAFNNLDTQCITESQNAKLKKLWEQYNSDGAFPEIALTETKEIKEKRLQGYYNAMLLRDLAERHSISNTKALRYFIKRLMNNISKPTSINAIYNDMRSLGVKITKDVLYDWADYVCECFMFIKVPKYTHSLSEEQRTLSKYYFIDNGMRQCVLLPQSNDNGKLLENSVLLHLARKSKTNEKIFYYQGSKECDFVVQSEDSIKELIQVCWDISDADTKKRELDGILEAAKVTDCNNLYIITHSTEESITINEQTIHIIPAYKWMLGI